TDEVGVITGDLTLRTELTDGNVVLRVQYKDAHGSARPVGARLVGLLLRGEGPPPADGTVGLRAVEDLVLADDR
ncbi:hypothetical protein AB0H87_36495, partial [Asanoa sp. NPDC050611]